LVNWVISTVETNGYKYAELEDSGAVTMISVDGVIAVQIQFPTGNELSTYVKSPNGFGYLISLQQNGDDPSVPGNAPVPPSFQQDDQAIYQTFIGSFRLGELTPRLEALKKTNVEPLENAIANTFRVPLDSDSLSFIYAVHPLWWEGTSPCYQTAYKNLYHAGEDWANSPGTEVKAVANGVVAIYQPGYNTYPGRVVVIEHELPDGNIVYSMYGHLDVVNVYQGQKVFKDNTIGTILYWPGDPDNSHVHWEMRYFPDGSNLCLPRPSGYYGPGYTYPDHPDSYGYTNPSNFVNSHNGITGCPSIYGEVRLYDLKNCGGNYTPANGPGLWDLTGSFNDLAESIIVPNGWSARLYKQDNELISSACFTTTDKNLWNDTFDDLTTVANETTWMRVFGNSSCYGLPKAPSLTSPGNGQGFDEGNSIPFSWSATGSEYYGEIWGGPDGSLTFGWQTETSRSMGPLPAGYKYYWHVKARNASGTSSWSRDRKSVG
jgi:murein DD-endopeptidase MepM/ murein hydrolase activator NlpD